MKKRILTAIAAFAFIALSAYAVPAKPGFRTYTQPDGRTLVLEQMETNTAVGSGINPETGMLWTGTGISGP